MITFPHIPEWMERGKCAGTDPALWFPETGENQEARSICAERPVSTECLDYALTHRETHGIWGGLTPHERKCGVAKPKECRGCGEPFTPVSLGRKWYCSEECSAEGRRRSARLNNKLRRAEKQRGAA